MPIAQRDLHLARLGALAPSRHNTQPWKFSIGGSTICVHPDLTRRLPATDPHDRSLYLSLGCAAENIAIAAEHYGLSGEVDYAGDEPDEPALIRLGRQSRNLAPELISVMALRQCNRRPFSGAKIARLNLKKLVCAGMRPGIGFEIVTDDKGIANVADVLYSAGSDQPRSGLTAELISWTRFNRWEAESSRDGLLFTSMGYPPVPRCIGRRLVAAMVRSKKHARKSASLVGDSAALVVFAPDKDDRLHWFDVGRSFQRVMLTAASLRIRYAHIQLPYSSPAHSGDLRWCFGLGGEQEFLALRIGYSDLAPPSLRRSVCDLLSTNFAIAPEDFPQVLQPSA